MSSFTWREARPAVVDARLYIFVSTNAKAREWNVGSWDAELGTLQRQLKLCVT